MRSDRALFLGGPMHGEVHPIHAYAAVEYLVAPDLPFAINPMFPIDEQIERHATRLVYQPVVLGFGRGRRTVMVLSNEDPLAYQDEIGRAWEEAFDRMLQMSTITEVLRVEG